MKVALFVPCYVDQISPQVALAAATVLQRLGHEVIFPEAQTCCGQPAFNTGYWPEAASLAVRQLRTFLDSGADAVVCPSGSCAAMQKVFYPTLLAGGAAAAEADTLAGQTWELSQFLVRKLGVTDVGARFPGVGTIHTACHGLRELGCVDEVRLLMENVKELTLKPLPMADECCGFGGTFAVKVADVSSAMGDIKADAILGTGAEWVISGDTSCLMHLDGLLRRRESPVRGIHFAEVLAAV